MYISVLKSVTLDHKFAILCVVVCYINIQYCTRIMCKAVHIAIWCDTLFVFYTNINDQEKKFDDLSIANLEPSSKLD